ncbi:MAG: hypothetical protein M1165_02130 [Candidatus Pacearchaeota archaeon]|nr:hypothetical protein [Candidatus Pacearchaeota archaeon]
MKKTKVVGAVKVVVRNGKPISKIGFDTGVLVALIDNDNIPLSQIKLFIKKGLCYVCQIVVNQVIGVLHYKRKYSVYEAKSKTLGYLEENNITLIKESDIDTDKRDSIFNDLKKKRSKISISPKPEDSDLEILATYKSENIDCIPTTNFKHFIELGKYLDIYIEGIYDEKTQEMKKVDKMWKGLFWKPGPKRKRFR